MNKNTKIKIFMTILLCLNVVATLATTFNHMHSLAARLSVDTFYVLSACYVYSLIINDKTNFLTNVVHYLVFVWYIVMTLYDIFIYQFKYTTIAFIFFTLDFYMIIFLSYITYIKFKTFNFKQNFKRLK